MKIHEPTWNEVRAVFTVGETDTHFIEIIPMIHNHRVVLTPKNATYGYDVGWCYPNMDLAIAAVMLWYLTDATEPVDYIKRVPA